MCTYLSVKIVVIIIIIKAHKKTTIVGKIIL